MDVGQVMNGERFDNDVKILRTSVPEDLARAVHALETADIDYRLRSESESFLVMGRPVHEVSVDAWHEEVALDAVQGIPTEYELPSPVDENLAHSEHKLASAPIVTFVTVIVILVAGLLWRRFL